MHSQTTPGRSQQQGFLQGTADAFLQPRDAVPPTGLCWRGCRCRPLLLPLQPLLLPRAAQCGPLSPQPARPPAHSHAAPACAAPRESGGSKEAAIGTSTTQKDGCSPAISRSDCSRIFHSGQLFPVLSPSSKLAFQTTPVHRPALPLRLSPAVCDPGSRRSCDRAVLPGSCSQGRQQGPGAPAGLQSTAGPSRAPPVPPSRLQASPCRRDQLAPLTVTRQPPALPLPRPGRSHSRPARLRQRAQRQARSHHSPRCPRSPSFTLWNP